MYEITNGFKFDPAWRESYWHASVFDEFSLSPKKRNIVLFKLHGSVDWVLEKSTGRIRRGQAMYDLLDSDAFDNVLIYPATRKVAVDDPFYTAYEYFQRCCEKAKVCLTIGYSFRDYDALTRLRSAAGENGSLTLALMSLHADDLLRAVPIAPTQKVPLKYHFEDTASSKDYLEAISKLLAARLKQARAQRRNDVNR